MTSKAMLAALAIVEQAHHNCDATDDHRPDNFHYHIEYCIGVYMEGRSDDAEDEDLETFDGEVREHIAAVLEVVEGPFRYIVGCEYRTQDGQYVKVLGRASLQHPGYESLICSDGKHRYDRSTSEDSDAGRVTGTAHDYSYVGNFTRALQLRCSHKGCTEPANRRKQLTAYVGSDNMDNLCVWHQAEEDEYWKERWADYYGGVIV